MQPIKTLYGFNKWLRTHRVEEWKPHLEHHVISGRTPAGKLNRIEVAEAIFQKAFKDLAFRREPEQPPLWLKTAGPKLRPRQSPPMTPQEFKRIRAATGLSQGEFAEAIGLSESMVFGMERGVQPIRKVQALAALAIAGFRVPPGSPWDRMIDRVRAGGGYE